MKTRFLVLTLVLVLGFIFLAACAQADAATNTPTIQETSVAELPDTGDVPVVTEVPTEVPTQEPTATEEPTVVPTDAPTPTATATATLEPTPTPTEVPMYVGLSAKEVDALRQECLKENPDSLCVPLAAMPDGEVLYGPESERGSRVLIQFSPGTDFAFIQNTQAMLGFFDVNGYLNRIFSTTQDWVRALAVWYIGLDVREVWYRGECGAAPANYVGDKFQEGDIDFFLEDFPENEEGLVETSIGYVFAHSDVQMCVGLMGRYDPAQSGWVSTITLEDLLRTPEGSIVYVLPNP